MNLENFKPVTDNAASKILGVATQTLRNWRQQGKGPAYLKIGRSVRYLLEDLQHFKEKNRIDPEKGK